MNFKPAASSPLNLMICFPLEGTKRCYSLIAVHPVWDHKLIACSLESSELPPLSGPTDRSSETTLGARALQRQPNPP